MRAGEGGGKRGNGETIWGGGRKYIYTLTRRDSAKLRVRMKTWRFFFGGFVSDFGLGSCEEMDWVMRGGYHDC